MYINIPDPWMRHGQCQSSKCSMFLLGHSQRASGPGKTPCFLGFCPDLGIEGKATLETWIETLGGFVERKFVCLV